MNDFDAGPLADVDVVADGNRWTVVFARDLRHPPEAVWAALTDPAQLREWAPYTADRDLGATGSATLTMTDGGEEQDHEAEVLRADAPYVLEYTWGSELLRWELAPAGGGTRLTLRHTTGERAETAKYAAGWHLCVAVLERLLDGDPIGPIVGKKAMDYGWQDLHDAYAARIVD